MTHIFTYITTNETHSSVFVWREPAAKLGAVALLLLSHGKLTANPVIMISLNGFNPENQLQSMTNNYCCCSLLRRFVLKRIAPHSDGFSMACSSR